MKKCFPIILILTALVLILQVVANYFVTERETDYILKTEDNQYSIAEKLTVIDDVQYYDFKATDKDNNVFVFSYEGDFNKQPEIIKEFKYYEADDLSCFLPVYKRDNTGDVVCIYDGQQVNYSYLKQSNNTSIDKIINKVKADGYESKKWGSKSNKTTSLEFDSKKINVYQENILEDYTFLVWRYKGLYILNSEESVIKDYLDFDQYDNRLSALVGNMYVSADPGSEGIGVSELVYYNTKDMGKGIVHLEEATSSEFYFNGVFEDKLYMTDVGNSKQYSIDPFFDTVKLVGDKTSGFKKLEDGELVTVKASEFLAQEVYFNGSVTNDDISNKYSDVLDIKKDRNFYYFRTKDGNVYRSHEDSIENSELLFRFDNITEWVIKNDDILVTVGDMVYFYSDKYGLMPIAQNSELNYNYKNICDFWEA